MLVWIRLLRLMFVGIFVMSCSLRWCMSGVYCVSMLVWDIFF